MIGRTFPFRKDACREALGDAGTPAVVLYSIVVAAYGEEMYGDPDEGPMDAITLWTYLREDFGHELGDEVENKINAVRTAVETDVFFHDPMAFSALVTAIVDGDVDDAISGAFADISVAEIVCAINEVTMIRGEERPEFSPAVLAIIQREMLEEVEDPEDGESRSSTFIAGHTVDIHEWFRRMGVAEEHLQAIA